MGVHRAPLPCLRAGLYCAVAVSKTACDHHFASMLPEDGLPQRKAIAHAGPSLLTYLYINDVVTNSRDGRPVIPVGCVACCNGRDSINAFPHARSTRRKSAMRRQKPPTKPGLPVRSLARALEYEPGVERVGIVIAAPSPYVLAVGAVDGTEELVIKPLTALSVPGISGTARSAEVNWCWRAVCRSCSMVPPLGNLTKFRDLRNESRGIRSKPYSPFS